MKTILTMLTKKNKFYKVGTGCQFHGKVDIGRNTILGDYVILGYPKESRILKSQQKKHFSSEKENPTTIGINCRIDSHVIIHEGTLIKDHVIINDRCRI